VSNEYSIAFLRVSTPCVCVAAYPDVQERRLTADVEFIVLACDGIWDVLTNQEVIDFVRARIAQRMEPETVRFLTQHTLHNTFK